jgi:hypothetical protein
MARTPQTAEALFWDLVDELREHDQRIDERTIMGGKRVRVSGEFLGLVDYKGSGVVLNLPCDRVDELATEGIGRPFAQAGEMFRKRVAIAGLNRRPSTKLLVDAIAVVAPTENSHSREKLWPS